MTRTRMLASLAAATLTATAAHAYSVRVTIQNMAPDNGVAFSPFWVGFGDGSFDAFNSGMAASAGIMNVAELGDATMLDSEFKAADSMGVSTTILATQGLAGKIFIPGTWDSAVVDVDPMMNRYLDFAAMVVPSNDWFISLDDPMAAPIFDGSGNFMGPQTWTFMGTDVWEAGTEVNDPMASGGGAFIVGADATMGVAESGTVHVVNMADRGTYIGVAEPTGQSQGTGLTADPILRISVGYAMWGGADVSADGWADTTWLGPVWVNFAPWIYVQNLATWAYVPDPGDASTGGWVYVFKGGSM